MIDFQVKYIGEDCAGIKRLKRGKGFLYLDQDGERIDDKIILQRIQALGIPPNWRNVWICPFEDGHIQATGFDVKNRKQYIYHTEWRKLRSTAKFDKLKDFAKWLPAIRKKAYEDIRLSGWPRNKVLGLIILTLDEAHLRIGNTIYRDENDTFGLTTLRRRHLHFEKNKIIMEFKAKSGKYRKINIENNKLVKLIKACSELPGYEVFRYRENGSTLPVTSSDVNHYLKEISLEDFSSKDFRTWGGTVLALEKFPEAKRMVEENKKLKLGTTLVKLVAAELGNTQAICRSYYIHPAILQAVENDEAEKLYYEEDKTSSRFELNAAERKAVEIISADESGV
jgi:DNA topoisomerase I